MRLTSLFLVLSLFFISCEKDEISPVQQDSSEIFIFGAYNNFCNGNCTTLFKVEDDKVFRDNIQYLIYGDPIVFRSEALSETFLSDAQSIKENFPELLLNSTQEL